MELLKHTHGNTKVSDADILLIKDQLSAIDVEISNLMHKESQVLRSYNITKGHYKKRLRDMESA